MINEDEQDNETQRRRGRVPKNPVFDITDDDLGPGPLAGEECDICGWHGEHSDDCPLAP